MAANKWSVEALDVVAEVHESALVSQVKTGADQAGRADLYAEWRRYVTSHAVLGPADFLTAKNRFLTVPQWSTWLDESYEPIPTASLQAGQTAVCGECDQWMVPARSGGWACGTPRCLRAASLPAPELHAGAGAYRLREELVRFIALPGRPELALAKSLADRGARVVLYPELDTLDMVAIWPGDYAIGVDVKDWHNPYLLARHIKRFPSWRQDHPFAFDRGFVVVPRDRVSRNRAYCDIVRRHSAALRSQPHIGVLTDDDLIRQCPDTGRAGEIVCGA